MLCTNLSQGPQLIKSDRSRCEAVRMMCSAWHTDLAAHVSQAGSVQYSSGSNALLVGCWSEDMYERIALAQKARTSLPG